MRNLLFAAIVLSSIPAAAQSAPPALGYVTLYVNDVPGTIAFYEQAFGISRKFITPEKTYGEMVTGTTRLAFITPAAMKEVIPNEQLNTEGTAGEIAFITPDVQGLFDRAVKAGAKPVLAPVAEPWGQTIAYVRDLDGHLVGIGTPLP